MGAEKKINRPTNSGEVAENVGAFTEVMVPVWSRLCDKVIAAYKAGEDIVVLQHFEELRATPELDVIAHDSLISAAPDLTVGAVEKKEDDRAAKKERLEYCWGRALLSARHLAGDDDEHINSIVESFEQQFGCVSGYLRALAINAESALEVLQLYQMMEGPVTTRVATAALHRFLTNDASEVSGLLQFLKLNNVPLTREFHDQLEKNFVMRMKTEDAEEVFKDMRNAGVEPVSTHPYNFIFMKTPPFKYMDLLDYYEDMLDRGIVPMNSTFRILSRQTQNGGLVNQHFSALARGTTTGSDRRHETEGHGGTQAFFATRLEELARLKSSTTLDDALRVLRRMDVEGTPLISGSVVLNVLLSVFCRAGHIEDTERVLQLAKERGCTPNGATLSRVLKKSNADRFLQAELILPDALEAGDVRLSDITDVMCHFFNNGMRSQVVRILRAYVVRCYRNPTESIPHTVALWALRLGPFDWALGFLAILLASNDEPLSDRIQRRMHEVVKENRSREILKVLEGHKWDRRSILLAPQLQEPTNSSDGAGEVNGRSSEGGNSGGGHHRRDMGPSWMSAMHLVLKEMGVEKEVLMGYKAKLSALINDAKKKRDN
ncbi:hypothetical protein, conserved [Trypanosoma brucei brucei TREU927]|uniref:Pentacotripeptide-repeat region of PRORP domain-containing protein n=1 Tax=Trypanosoma brucei brucei (strain 927/4 GUTat10.1) TaxID=185431 RepID=Q38CF9_TRYB2|nr:hypothetical protein, conserved [Trypanosoma brucei brucei TREU927]EAN77511.1 hypothetical protein, conserved [Trypanosoma brucei brucei TREU927]